MNLDARVAAIASAAAGFSWLSDLSADNIRRWIELELGDYLSDSELQPYGHQHCLAAPLSPVLHIVSGNTPHAGLQSLVRGIVVGATNWMKLPSKGLPEVESFARGLPSELQPELATKISPHWTEAAEAIVVFGSDQTIQEFSRMILPFQRFLAHGHKISLGLIWSQCDPRIAEGIAQDVFPFDQMGCLSPQFFYVAGDSVEFASRLAKQLEVRPRSPEPSARASETTGALRAFREEWKFRAATESGVFVWESLGNLDWVIIHDPTPGLVANPLHGTIFIKPIPSEPELALAPIRRLISTIGLFPVSPESAALAIRCGAQRICQIGQMQHPLLTWHHDGWPTLGSFVRYVDVEGI
jgi:hypothetical protein